ncbi:MAG TPA: rhomboid family intramembrane serine protease [Planctomycetota bacterium]|nr:rhomboid family intramembrane serine protease [Planctomycetota bacterium]
MYYFFYLPVGTEARVRGIAWGTIFLAVANVWIFLFFQLVPGWEAEFYSLTFRAGEPSLWNAVSAAFLHAGWLHLLSNMIYLGVFGPPVEVRLGRARFLIAYVGCAGLANLAQAAWVLRMTPDLTSMPILGSSGAIAGLMGLFLVRLYYVRLKFAAITFLFLQGFAKGNRFALPSIVAIGFWFALQATYQLVSPNSGTAYVSHIAGLLAGVVFALVMGMAAEGALERRLILGDRYAARADWFAALGEYDAYLARRPGDPEVLIQAARIHRVTHQEQESLRRFREGIAEYLRRGEVAEACEAFDGMKRLLGDVTVEPENLLQIARGFENAKRPSDASRAYEAYGRRYPEAPGAVAALLKCADIERKRLNNPARAQYIYRELLAGGLPSDIESLVHESMRITEEAIQRQRGAA